MQPLLRRIAIHGVLTAVVLGLIGAMMAEMASMWLAASPAGRTPQSQANATISASLRSRVPLLLAIWGFAFVAIGEILLHYWRRGRVNSPPPGPAQPDSAERLLEELLAQAESKAKAANPDGTVAPPPATTENVPTPPTPPPLNQGGE